MSTESSTSQKSFEFVGRAHQDNQWHCGPETDSVPVYFGNPKTLTSEQLDMCRLYPRIMRGDFPYSISSTLIGLWNTIGRIEGRYKENKNFSLKKNLLCPIVLKYPDDFPSDKEFEQFTNEFYSGINAMDAHGGKLSEWSRIAFDPSLDKRALSHQEYPTINLESVWWHERRHASKAVELGYKNAGYYYLSLDIMTRDSASTRLSGEAAFARLPDNISREDRWEMNTAPLFPSRSDWEDAFSIDRGRSLRALRQKPWFALLSDQYVENIGHIDGGRLANICDSIQMQLLRPDIFTADNIDNIKLEKYIKQVPRSANYIGYFPPIHKYLRK